MPQWAKLFWKGSGGKITRFVFTERFVAVVARAIDALMIYLIVKYGVAVEIAIVVPLYFIMCVAVVRVYDFFLTKGYDLLEIEAIRSLGNKKLARRQVFKRFTRWIARRKVTIFWLGSIFLLDPDAVTLFLRKRGASATETALKITLPSVVWAIVFWSVIYKLGIMGVKYFTWAVQ